MYVGTVHALCHRLLQDRSLVVDRERSTAPAVLDELDQYFTLAQGSFWTAAKSLLAFEGELPAFREMLSANFEPPASASRFNRRASTRDSAWRRQHESRDQRTLIAAPVTGTKKVEAASRVRPTPRKGSSSAQRHLPAPDDRLPAREVARRKHKSRFLKPLSPGLADAGSCAALSRSRAMPARRGLPAPACAG